MYDMKIYLIGFMGSGKSTVGKLLSGKLGYNFIDLDEYIEKETGRTIFDLFDQGGEDKFRMLEHEHLKKLLAKDDVVIALGGGTPCFYNNMSILNKGGISIYLEIGVTTLVKRLSKDKKKRPLIRDLTEAELKLFIEEELKKRLIIYRKAHHIVNAEMESAKEMANEIAIFLKKEN